MSRKPESRKPEDVFPRLISEFADSIDEPALEPAIHHLKAPDPDPMEALSWFKDIEDGLGDRPTIRTWAHLTRCFSLLRTDPLGASSLLDREIQNLSYGTTTKACVLAFHGDCARESEKPGKALDYYLRSFRTHPSATACHVCVVGLKRIPDYPKAKGIIKEGLENLSQDSTRAKLLVHRSEIYALQGNLGNAVEDIDTAISLNPSGADGYIHDWFLWALQQFSQDKQHACEQMIREIARLSDTGGRMGKTFVNDLEGFARTLLKDKASRFMRIVRRHLDA